MSTNSEEGLADLAHSESPGEVIARYDGWATEYDADLAGWNYQVPLRVAEQIAAAPTTSAGAVLDAGCGTGLVGRALKAQGISRLWGCDASQESLTFAEATEAYERLDVVDLTKPLPYEDAKFGAVACGGVLTYIREPEPLLGEFARVTAAGGLVVATQRTDLWVERRCDDVVESLKSEPRISAVESSDPQPYLPLHPEYADDILVRYITITIADH